MEVRRGSPGVGAQVSEQEDIRGLTQNKEGDLILRLEENRAEGGGKDLAATLTKATIFRPIPAR